MGGLRETAAGAQAETRAVSGGQPLPLGTCTPIAAPDPACPPGHECQGVTVRCPGVSQDARGVLAVARPAGPPRGLVMFFAGGPGTEWWTRERQIAAEFLERLRRERFTSVQVRWVDSWLFAPPGDAVGPARLACRTATVVQWAHDQLYAPAPGGFCLTGNSGGASQVCYALSHYGLDGLLDAVIPTGGPPHAALAKGCLRNPGDESHWFTEWAYRIMDASYGYPREVGGGPCEARDAAFVQRWLEDGIDTGGNCYYHPTTVIHFIFGGQDRTVAVANGRAYLARLREAGSPYVSEEVVPEMPHAIHQSPDGLAALLRALLAPKPEGLSDMGG